MFEVTPLLTGGTMVRGTDVTGAEGSTVLWSDAWQAVQKAKAQDEAMSEFDASVEAFFAPLTEAADKLASINEPSEWETVTIGEQVEGQTAKVIHLDHDGVLLRLLAETDGSSLRWLDQSTLVAVK
jgi:hypothetical protein